MGRDGNREASSSLQKSNVQHPRRETQAGAGRAPHNPGEHLALTGEVQTSWMTILVVASK